MGGEGGTKSVDDHFHVHCAGRCGKLCLSRLWYFVARDSGKTLMFDIAYY